MTLIEWFREWWKDVFVPGMGLDIDIAPDLDTMATLEQPAACDKHRELVDAVAIAALQERIVASGGTVRVVSPQEHAARRKGRMI